MHKQPLISRLVAVAAMLAAAVALVAATRYHTAVNGFGGLRASVPGCTLAVRHGQWAALSNATPAPVLVLDTVPVRSADYRCQVRIANLHSKPGNTYHAAGRAYKSTWSGLALNAAPDGSRWVAVELSCANTDLHNDATDRRLLTVSVVNHRSGCADSVLASATVTDGVDLYDGFNCIEAEVQGGSLAVSVGNRRLSRLLECRLPDVQGGVWAGCIAGPASSVQVERVVVSEKAGQERPLDTGLTLDSLNSRFAASTDPYEGYWQYLDRETDDTRVRIGGRYVVALVADGADGYRIVYVSGAQAMRRQWHTGMVKAVMHPTVFTANYRVRWSDAAFGVIDDDVFATFESGAILSLKFPVLKSQIRFSKMPQRTLTQP